MWFEDIEIGGKRVLGTHTFTEDEIIAFAKKYDPQSFHIDPEAAKASMFGGLIASGWHTAAIWMRLAIESRQREAAGRRRRGPGRGFARLSRTCKWLRPVRPGDTPDIHDRNHGQTGFEVAPRARLGAEPQRGARAGRRALYELHRQGHRADETEGELRWR